jgi:hypothetical protein
VDRLLAALSEAAGNQEMAGVHALPAVQSLNAAAASLEATMRPVVSAVPGARARELREQLMLALTARYWLHRLLARAIFHRPTDCAHLAAQVDATRERLALNGDGRPAAPSPPEQVRSPADEALLQVETLLRTLSRSREGDYLQQASS